MGAGASTKYKTKETKGVAEAPTKSPAKVDDEEATKIVETITADEVSQLLEGLLTGSELMLAAVKAEFSVFLLRLLNGETMVASAVRDELSAVLSRRKEKEAGSPLASQGEVAKVIEPFEPAGICGQRRPSKEKQEIEDAAAAHSSDTEATTATGSAVTVPTYTSEHSAKESASSDNSGFDSNEDEDEAERANKLAIQQRRRSSNAVREIILDRRRQSTTNIFKGTTAAADFDHSMKKLEYQESIGQHHMYTWLGWTPDTGSACYESLHKYFPGALPGPVVHVRLAEVLRKEYGFAPDNTLVGLSICPDELNHRKGGLAHLMSEFWGECFPLGGIGGAPFVGKTGFAAFNGHVPEGGNTLLLYGPHVAISEEGEVGKYLRAGQKSHSTACGAVIGAYNACRCVTEDFEEEEIDESDMQMSWLRAQILPHTERIKEQENPLAQLSYQAYEMVKAATDKIVTFSQDRGYTAIVGGIQLNMPAPYVDHFLPLNFDLCKAGEEPSDIMSAFKCQITQEGVFSSEYESSRAGTGASVRDELARRCTK